jgi:hypothetical protein
MQMKGAAIMLASLINQLIRKLTASEELRRKQVEEFNDVLQQNKLREMYEVERKPLYLQARTLFNTNMKAGKIHKLEFDYLEKLVTKSLGACIEEYKYYKFQNKAHRLYVLMKDQHIEPNEWKLIIHFLEGIG